MIFSCLHRRAYCLTLFHLQHPRQVLSLLQHTEVLTYIMYLLWADDKGKLVFVVRGLRHGEAI